MVKFNKKLDKQLNSIDIKIKELKKEIIEFETKKNHIVINILSETNQYCDITNVLYNKKLINISILLEIACHMKDTEFLDIIENIDLYNKIKEIQFEEKLKSVNWEEGIEYLEKRGYYIWIDQL
jgi:methionine synthase II (cobalamin-independent)